MLYGFRAALIAGAGRAAPEQTTMTTSPAPLTAAQALLHESDAIAGAILADVQGGEPRSTSPASWPLTSLAGDARGAARRT